MAGKKKDSVSVNTYVGSDLFEMLELFCAITGQSKTVAVERAIESYCRPSVENNLVLNESPTE